MDPTDQSQTNNNGYSQDPQQDSSMGNVSDQNNPSSEQQFQGTGENLNNINNDGSMDEMSGQSTNQDPSTDFNQQLSQTDQLANNQQTDQFQNIGTDNYAQNPNDLAQQPQMAYDIASVTPEQKSGKAKYILIFVMLVGVLMVAGGATYYFLVYKPQVDEIAQSQEQPVIEEPQEEVQQDPLESPDELTEDPYIQQIDQNLDSSDISQIEKDLVELDYQGIVSPDQQSEMQDNTGNTTQSPDQEMPQDTGLSQ